MGLQERGIGNPAELGLVVNRLFVPTRFKHCALKGCVDLLHSVWAEGYSSTSVFGMEEFSINYISVISILRRVFKLSQL